MLGRSSCRRCEARAMERRAHVFCFSRDERKTKEINKSTRKLSPALKNQKNLFQEALFRFRFRSRGDEKENMKNNAAPLSSGSPRGIHSLPRLSVPPPCSFNDGAPLLISPRRLTGAFSPPRGGSRPVSLDIPRSSTNNECSAGSTTSSSFVDRRSRTTSETEVIQSDSCGFGG